MAHVRSIDVSRVAHYTLVLESPWILEDSRGFFSDKIQTFLKIQIGNRFLPTSQ